MLSIMIVCFYANLRQFLLRNNIINFSAAPYLKYKINHYSGKYKLYI